MQTSQQTHIVILGGGFGGVYTALGLQDIWDGDPAVKITLVSRNNYFLMTPLLFEAGSGVLEPRHVVNPLRPLFDDVRFIEAEVKALDLKQHHVTIMTPGGELQQIPYNHLVLAMGGVTNTKLVPGSEHALTFKTLADAIYLRNHIIQLFERADVEKDPARKKAQLTFVLVGGGLVNVELCGELTAFMQTLQKLYPRVNIDDLHVEMIEGEGAIAREFDEDLRQYITETLQSRGVKIRLNTRVKQIEPGKIHLPDGTLIESETIVLGTGVVPSPLVASLPIEKDKHGRAITEATMQCKGRTDLWALGDCALIPDPDGKPYPPLAQHALREARVLARNISASLRGEALEPFVYKSKGTLAALGHFQGAGKLMKLEIRGFLAWWVWRTYYVMQMRSWSRRIRIILDWTVALFTKNDIVQLDYSPRRPPGYGPERSEFNRRLFLPSLRRIKRYLATMTGGRLVLWFYFIWYLVVAIRYFEADPYLWLTAIGISAIIGTALWINTTRSGSRLVKLETWPVLRLYLFPFCVSSFAALVKHKGFIFIFSPHIEDAIVAVSLCAALSAAVLILKRTM